MLPRVKGKVISLGKLIKFIKLTKLRKLQNVQGVLPKVVNK